MYNWVVILYSRNYHNTVLELYFNKTLKNENNFEKEGLLNGQICQSSY